MWYVFEGALEPWNPKPIPKLWDLGQPKAPVGIVTITGNQWVAPRQIAFRKRAGRHQLKHSGGMIVGLNHTHPSSDNFAIFRKGREYFGVVDFVDMTIHELTAFVCEEEAKRRGIRSSQALRGLKTCLRDNGRTREREMWGVSKSQALAQS